MILLGIEILDAMGSALGNPVPVDTSQTLSSTPSAQAQPASAGPFSAPNAYVQVFSLLFYSL